MKLLARVQLNPTEIDRSILLDTMQKINEAQSWVGQQEVTRRDKGQLDGAAEKQTRREISHELKIRFGLTSRMIDLVIVNVRNWILKGDTTPPVFTKTEPIIYDEKLLSWDLKNEEVALWTFYSKRLPVTFTCGDHQRRLLACSAKNRQSSLVFFENDFYLFTEVDVREPAAEDIQEVWR